MDNADGMARAHHLAGRCSPQSALIDPQKVLGGYYTLQPDLADPAQRVAFGTSGHRGSSLRRSFNEAHVFAMTQAICNYRRTQGCTGPIYLGKDSHALSEPALRTALEVLAANDVDTMIDREGGYTPTPVISHAILSHNRHRTTGLADGIVITPSHNPPEDGGLKYNPAHGGPADSGVTRWIEKEANALLSDSMRGIRRVPFETARAARTVHAYDYLKSYVEDLGMVVDLKAVCSARLKIGVDPLGGASLVYWTRICERYGLGLELVRDTIDPTFGFMPLDRDGRIRMDCSSPYAMADLVALKDRFDLAFANDTDGDRHGIVTPTAGLMKPNDYLATAIAYLYQHRLGWNVNTAVGKTIVSSSIIDRVAAKVHHKLFEPAVGFKWFVPGLYAGSLGFGGEESAGASFLRRDGAVWTTDKDGIIMNLLGAEMMAITGRDPSELYEELTRELGAPAYERIDSPATSEEKAALLQLSAADIKTTHLAGDTIRALLTRAPSNGASIGGLKVVTANGWFAARPSGTEDVYKLYAESFLGPDHLHRIQMEGRALISNALERTVSADANPSVYDPEQRACQPSKSI